MLETSRQHQSRAVDLLEPMPQHRAVDLGEDVLPNVDACVRIDTHNVRVVRRVMDLAQPETVGDEWLAAWIPILEDVRRIEQLAVAQSANRALLAIGT